MLLLGLELQADFLAGVWANRAQQNRDILEPGDVVPDSFTHGTSEQRMRWFQKGFQTGDVDQGDTFSAERL